MDTGMDAVDVLFAGLTYAQARVASTLPATRYSLVASDGSTFAEDATLAQCHGIMEALGGGTAGWVLVDRTWDYTTAPVPRDTYFAEHHEARPYAAPAGVEAPQSLAHISAGFINADGNLEYVQVRKEVRKPYKSADEARILANPTATVARKPFIGYAVLDVRTLEVLRYGAKDDLAPWIRKEVGVRSRHKIRVVQAPKLRAYRESANVIVTWHMAGTADIVVRGTADECKSYLRERYSAGKMTDMDLSHLKVTVAA